MYKNFVCFYKIFEKIKLKDATIENVLTFINKHLVVICRVIFAGSQEQFC